MKKLILLPLILLCLLLNGCPGPGPVKPTDSTTAITSAQKTAEKALYDAGVVLKATAPILDTLYVNGKISKSDYNKSAVIYNRALASFNVAVNTMRTAIAAGQDPNKMSAYITAFATFTTDLNNINNLVVALGGTK